MRPHIDKPSDPAGIVITAWHCRCSACATTSWDTLIREPSRKSSRVAVMRLNYLRRAHKYDRLIMRFWLTIVSAPTMLWGRIRHASGWAFDG